MRVTRFVSASLVALALAATMGSTSTSAQSTAADNTTAPIVTAEPAGQFATLNGIKAVPMASSEMQAVKGLHIHFFVNGVLHVVNHRENNLGGGQAHPASGPGYSGLCKAQNVSGAISGAVPC